MDQDLHTLEIGTMIDDAWYTAENSTLGDRLSGAREAAGMTRAELARRMGVKTATIQKWEDDLGEPRANRLNTLSGLLGVSLRWLLTAEGEGVDGPAGDEPLSDDAVQLLKDLRQVKGDLNRAAAQVGVLEKRLRKVMRTSE